MATAKGRKTVRATFSCGTTVQEKFFRLLSQRIEGLHSRGRKVELVTRAAWANTGGGYVQVTTSFEALSKFTYDFQDNYARFVVNGKDWRAVYAPGTFAGEVGLETVLDEIVKPVS